MLMLRQTHCCSNHLSQRQMIIQESYIYRVHMVCTTSLYPSYFLLKATILYTCALMSSFRSFYYVLGLWCHIMWHVMWLQCYMPSSLFKIKIKRKEKKKKINIKSEKKNKRKIKIVSVSATHNTHGYLK